MLCQWVMDGGRSDPLGRDKNHSQTERNTGRIHKLLPTALKRRRAGRRSSKKSTLDELQLAGKLTSGCRQRFQTRRQFTRPLNQRWTFFTEPEGAPVLFALSDWVWQPAIVTVRNDCGRGVGSLRRGRERSYLDEWPPVRLWQHNFDKEQKIEIPDRPIWRFCMVAALVKAQVFVVGLC